MSSEETLNWAICCLCQEENSEEPLQTPKEQGFISLERDLKDFCGIDPNTLPAGINVSISNLDNGSFRHCCNSESQ